jgi:nitrate reductase cytochrome c-type subunit
MRHSEAFVRGQFECLDCHRNGMWLGKRLARPMSHVELANCTQCHVEAVNEVLVQSALPPANSFEGLETRVPPPISHETALREDCRDCHELLSDDHGGDPHRTLRSAEEARASRPASWPALAPITPHGAGDEARRDCRGCHVTDVDPSVEVAHPLGRARFADCLSCHRGDAHEPFGAPRVAPGQLGKVAIPPVGDVAAREACLSCHVFATPSGEIEKGVGVLPPRIPHGTLLRTRCISCHGEYGYAGLRIDHVYRSQCLQCHLPMTGVEAGPPTAFR